MTRSPAGQVEAQGHEVERTVAAGGSVPVRRRLVDSTIDSTVGRVTVVGAVPASSSCPTATTFASLG